MSHFIYVLKLEDNFFYVGKTTNVKKRFEEHKNGNGSAFTKIHKPIKILFTIEGDGFVEETITLKLMKRVGIHKVRGGSYCKTKLTIEDYKRISIVLKSVEDKCFKCNSKKHFTNNCDVGEIATFDVNESIYEIEQDISFTYRINEDGKKQPCYIFKKH